MGKKIAVAAADKKVEIKNTVHCEPVETEFEHGGKNYRVTISPLLKLSKYTEMIETIARRALDCGYSNASFDYSFMRTVVEFYSDVSLPQDDDDAYEILMMSNLFLTVADNVDQEQIEHARYDARDMAYIEM